MCFTKIKFMDILKNETLVKLIFYNTKIYSSCLLRTR